MYGQLKSTVKCAECGKISITYDPFLTLPLPISKPNYFKTAFVPFDIFRPKTASSAQDSSSEDDPDFKDERTMAVNEHIMFNFTVTSSTTVLDVKKMLIEKVSKIGGRTIYPENLNLTKCKYGEISIHKSQLNKEILYGKNMNKRCKFKLKYHINKYQGKDLILL